MLRTCLADRTNSSPAVSVLRLAKQKLPIDDEELRDGRKSAGYLASTNFNGSVTGVGKLGCRISKSARPGVSA